MSIVAMAESKAFLAGYGVGRLNSSYALDYSGLTPQQQAALLTRPREVRFLWEAYTRQLILSFGIDETNKIVGISVIPRPLRRAPKPDEAAAALQKAVMQVTPKTG